MAGSRQVLPERVGMAERPPTPMADAYSPIPVLPKTVDEQEVGVAKGGATLSKRTAVLLLAQAKSGRHLGRQTEGAAGVGVRPFDHFCRKKFF